MKKAYKEPGRSFDTFFGEGGYVFEFDQEKTLINEPVDGIDMEAFIDATLEEEFWYELANLGVDWAMYNSNYDFIIYNAILFQYLPNGQLVTILKTTSFRTEPNLEHYITLFFFMCFYIYFLVKFLQDLWLEFKGKQGAGKQY